MKLLLINSNIESSFAASFIEGNVDVKYTSDFLDSSERAYLKSPDKLINCLKYITDSIINSGIKLSEIDAVAVITGPGSFTGIRVGIALAKGFADTLRKKIIPIDNFELIQKQAENFIKQDKYCFLIPAKRPEFYYKLFEKTKEIESGCVLVEDINAKFDKFTVLVGDFSHDYQEKLGYFDTLDKRNINTELDSMVKLAIEKYNKSELYEPKKIKPVYMKEFIFKHS